jgi:holo-[acyl-carrier protein] synthase
VALHRAAVELAAAAGVERWHLSLTHTDTVATAFVVAEG